MNVLFCLQVKVAACVCSSCPALTQRSFCCWTWTQPCSQWLEAEVWKALALLIHVLEGILLSSFLCLSRVQCLFLCIHWANLFIWTNVFHVNRHADSCGAHLELTKSSWFVCWTLPWVLRAACNPNCWGCSLYILISLTNCSFSFLILQNTVKASEETRQFLDKLMSRGPWFYGSSPDPVPDWLGAAGRGLGFVAGCHLRVTPRLRCQNGKAPRNNDQKKQNRCCGARWPRDPKTYKQECVQLMVALVCDAIHETESSLSQLCLLHFQKVAKKIQRRAQKVVNFR